MMNLNPGEVADVKYEDMGQLKLAIDSDPAKFTTWFRIAFPKVESWWMEYYGKRMAGNKTGKTS